MHNYTYAGVADFGSIWVNCIYSIRKGGGVAAAIDTTDGHHHSFVQVFGQVRVYHFVKSLRTHCLTP